MNASRVLHSFGTKTLAIVTSGGMNGPRLQKLAAKKKTLPRYMSRAARPWFKKGKALQKELAR